MIDLWFAIALSIVIVITTIYFSVSFYLGHQADLAHQTDSSNEIDKNSNHSNGVVFSKKGLLLLPIIFLLSSIFLYSQNPSVELHENWLNTQIETKNLFQISSGELFNPKDVKTNTDKGTQDIQSMMLGLRTLAHKDPDNADLWFMLAESYFQLSMVDLADESMKRAIRLKPSANWYAAYAQILALRSTESDLARAIGFLQSAIRLEPEHQSAMLTMGFLYMRQQKHSQAIEIWSFLASLIDKNGGDSSRIRQQIESILERVKQKTTIE